MGVFRLFRYYLNHFENFYKCLHNPYKTNLGSQKPAYYCDWLLIDTNAIMHPAVKGVMLPDPNSAVSILMQELNEVETNYADKEEAAFEAVWNAVVNLMKLAQPVKGIFLAIDGTPGLCKQSQQRKRRFKTCKDTPKDQLQQFDSSNLSCGTAFMDRLCTYLRTCLQNMKSTHQCFKHLSILFSDMYVPGEGEHKLIRWMESQSVHQSYTLYSPDADLLMLSLILPQRNIYVLRENIYNDVRGDWLSVNIDKLRVVAISTILTLAPTLQSKPDWHTRRVLQDYVLYFMLLGNDFLPHGSGLEIINEGIVQLNNAYAQTLLTHTYLINSNLHINFISFSFLLQQLAQMEPLMLAQKYLRNKWSEPDSLIVAHTTLTLDGTQATINFQAYRQAYYKKKFGIENIDEHKDQLYNICFEYVHGLAFVTQYYAKQIPTFDWFYPYHYAPLCCDIVDYLQQCNQEQFERINTFKFVEPLNVLESLVSVLPLGSFNACLPLSQERISKLVIKITTKEEFSSFFPTDFVVDIEGVINEYEGTCILPVMNHKQTKALCRGLPKPLVKFKCDEI